MQGGLHTGSPRDVLIEPERDELEAWLVAEEEFFELFRGEEWADEEGDELDVECGIVDQVDEKMVVEESPNDEREGASEMRYLLISEQLLELFVVSNLQMFESEMVEWPVEQSAEAARRCLQFTVWDLLQNSFPDFERQSTQCVSTFHTLLIFSSILKCY